MNHPSPEVLAAFVDGRLSGEERRGVVAHLDACPDCYEVFAETVRFQGEEEPRGQVLRPPHFAAKRWLGWAAAAAAVVAVAIALPILRMESERPVHTVRNGGPPALSAAELVAELPDGGDGTPAPASAVWDGWPEGLGFAGDLDRGRASFRAGVRLLDLSVAARDGHAGAAERALDGLAEVLERSGAAAELRDELGTARRDLEDRDFEALGTTAAGLEAGAEELLDPSRLAFGKWAEAGRLAAVAGDRTLFVSPAFAGFREELRAQELSGPVRRALERIDGLTRAEAAPGEERAELVGAFEVLVRVAG